MATFTEWLGMTTSPVSAHYFGTAVSVDYSTGDISQLYATTTAYSGGAPWNVNLYRSSYDFFGQPFLAPNLVASYTVPATDPTTHATFDFAYRSLALGNGLTGNFWVTPYGTYTAGNNSQVKMQAYNTDGSKHGSAVALRLDGTSTVKKNLYDVALSSGADYGNSFIFAYSTYDPKTSAVQIGYEHFTNAGAPINGGILVSINDGTKHGIDFSSYYTTSYIGAHAPAYMLEYRLPVGTTAGIHAQLINADGSFGDIAFDILGHGPNGESAQVIDKYNFLRPSSTDAAGDYGVFTQTFGYVDSSLNIHEAVALEIVGKTGVIGAKLQFDVDPAYQPTILTARVLKGAFVIGYTVGGITFLKEYNSKLVQVGDTLQLPHSAQGLDSLQSLADGRIELSWRETSGSGNVQHFDIYDTRTAAIHYTGNGTNNQAAGTAFNDIFTTGAGHVTFYGAGGNDTFNVSTAPLLINGGTGTDTIVTTGAIAFAAGSVVDVEAFTVSNNSTADLSLLTVGEKIKSTSVATGKSTIIATSANDTITGGAGKDRIAGGVGADHMAGGSGADTFVYNSTADSVAAAAGRDTIMDFSSAQGDAIDVTMFGTGTTVSFVENAAQSAGTLTVKHGTQTIALVLDGAFIASGFGVKSDGSSGSLVTYTPPPAPAIVAPA